MICHNRDLHHVGRSNGKKGFVSEITRDNLVFGIDGIPFGALYSIYGFEQVKLHESEPDSISDYYFGDHLESELEWTGEVITVEALREYRKKFGDGMFANDIDVVITNLGREAGRNQAI